MDKKKIKRRFITLIEIMIVMFLIAMITGVVAYNYRGSLDEGKAFKTKTSIERIKNILSLNLAQYPELISEVNSGGWQELVRRDPTVSPTNYRDLLNDGWGIPYSVSVDQNGDISVHSEKFEEYRRTNNTRFR